MSYENIIAVVFAPFSIAIVYIAGKWGLLDELSQRFREWVDDLMMNTQMKNGLLPETKQTILNDFMKNSKN